MPKGKLGKEIKTHSKGFFTHMNKKRIRKEGLLLCFTEDEIKMKGILGLAQN